MANGYHESEHAEFKRLGHPDRAADHLSSSMGALLLGLDPNARFDIQCKAHYGPLEGIGIDIKPAAIVTLFGQVSSQVGKAEYGVLFNQEVESVFRQIRYNGSSGINPGGLLVLRSFNSQSEDIAAGIDKNGKPAGAGDATIAHGYASGRTENGLFVAHALVQSLVHRIDWAFRLGVVDGLEADGKAQAEVVFDQSGKPFAKTIIVAAQHDDGITLGNFRKEIRELAWSVNDLIRDSEGKLLNLIGKNTKIIVNGAGNFVKGGPLADTGVNGRMDTLYVSGGTQPHGGGLFFGRDGTKTDVSCLLEARNIALHFVQGNFAEEAKVTIEYAIGATSPSSVNVVLRGKDSGKYQKNELSAAVNAAFDLSPRGIKEQLSLSPDDFRSFARDGLFGIKQNGTHRWETVDCDKLQILKQRLKRRETVPVAAQSRMKC